MGLINVADAFSEYIRKVCTDALNNYAIQDGLRDEKVTPTIEPETEEEAYERGYTAGQMAYRKTGVWVEVNGYVTPGGDPVWCCSECGKGLHVYGVEHGTYGKDIADHQWVACPNCGAKMV